MSNLYCPFGCEFEKPLYGANGYDWWVPLCPECEAPLKVRQPTPKPTCPVCLKECIEIKDDMAIHRYMDDWVANMCVISPSTVAALPVTPKHTG